MPYPAILHRRMPYDVDGTVIARSAGLIANGITGWLSAANLTDLNKENPWTSVYNGIYVTLWFFFPEKREIEAMFIRTSHVYSTLNFSGIEGSNDTANGLDGNWEMAVLPGGSPIFSNATDFVWRENVRPISFSETKRVIRFSCWQSNYGCHVHRVHLYGRKAATETPDDILFLIDDTSEFTALKDWGDRPEGTVLYDSFRVKNNSGSKIANNINLQLNHTDFVMSWAAEGPWLTFLDIASLNPGGVSSLIYVRNLLAPPPLILGPKAARVIINVGSWT